jgi:hypothetical protein
MERKRTIKSEFCLVCLEWYPKSDRHISGGKACEEMIDKKSAFAVLHRNTLESL